MLLRLPIAFFQFPKSARISIMNTGLKYIDTELDQMLKTKSDVKINFKNNIHLECDGLEWMAPYVKNGQLEIDGSQCADKDHQPLREYLEPTTLGPTTLEPTTLEAASEATTLEGTSNEPTTASDLSTDATATASATATPATAAPTIATGTTGAPVTKGKIGV